MKKVFDKRKRLELKKEIKELASLIAKLKDNRKKVRPRRFPDFIRPLGTWLEPAQAQFRHKHIAASMMRGKTIAQIETLPKGWVWQDGKAKCRIAFKKYYEMPDMQFIKDLIFEHLLEESEDKIKIDLILGKVAFDEDVCIGSENPFQKPASGASRPRFGRIPHS